MRFASSPRLQLLRFFFGPEIQEVKKTSEEKTAVDCQNNSGVFSGIRGRQLHSAVDK